MNQVGPKLNSKLMTEEIQPLISVNQKIPLSMSNKNQKQLKQSSIKESIKSLKITDCSVPSNQNCLSTDCKKRTPLEELEFQLKLSEKLIKDFSHLLEESKNTQNQSQKSQLKDNNLMRNQSKDCKSKINSNNPQIPEPIKVNQKIKSLDTASIYLNSVLTVPQPFYQQQQHLDQSMSSEKGYLERLKLQFEKWTGKVKKD